MTDELTRRAVIAAHDASCPDRCEAAHMPSLSKREQAIVELWRADERANSERRNRLAEANLRERLAWAMRGTTDGDLIAPDSEIPIGEAERLAYEFIRAVLDGRCCDSHNRNCEPPSELCCQNCSEYAHPNYHPPGAVCVLEGEQS